MKERTMRILWVLMLVAIPVEVMANGRPEGIRTAPRARARELAAHLTVLRFREVVKGREITNDLVGRELGIRDVEAQKRWVEILKGKLPENQTEVKAFLEKFGAAERDLYDNPKALAKLELGKLHADLAMFHGRGGNKLLDMELPPHLAKALRATNAAELLAAVEVEPLTAVGSISGARAEGIVGEVRRALARRGAVDYEALARTVAVASIAERAKNGFEGTMAKSIREGIHGDLALIARRMVDLPELAEQIHSSIAESRQANRNNPAQFWADVGRIKRFQERITTPLADLSADGLFATLTGRPKVEPTSNIKGLKGAEADLARELQNILTRKSGELKKLDVDTRGGKSVGEALREAIAKEKNGTRKKALEDLRDGMRAEMAAKMADFLVKNRNLHPREACKGLACILNGGASPVVGLAILGVFNKAKEALFKTCPDCKQGEEILSPEAKAKVLEDAKGKKDHDD